MTTIEVIDCGEMLIDGKPVSRGCPFHVWEQVVEGSPANETCQLAGNVIHPDDPVRPRWCPLAKGDVLVRLRVTT